MVFNAITSTQNLLISFNSILCKLNYSHVIIYMTTPTVLPYWRRIPLRRGLLDTTVCDKVLSVTCGRFVVLSEYVFTRVLFFPVISVAFLFQMFVKFCFCHENVFMEVNLACMFLKKHIFENHIY
jgi:hypothetical protein